MLGALGFLPRQLVGGWGLGWWLVGVLGEGWRVLGEGLLRRNLGAWGCLR